MEGDALIDAAIKDILNIRNAFQLTDAELRAMVLRQANKRGRRFLRWKRWTWRIGHGDVTIATTGFGDAPSGFGTFGKHGTLSYATKRYELDWMEPQELMLRRTVETSSTSRPRWYTEAEIDDGVKQIFVHPKPSAQVVLQAVYDKAFAAITDTDTASGTGQFPEDYHETVLLEGVKADLYEKAGDGRQGVAEAAFMRGMIECWKEEKEGQHAEKYATGRYGACAGGYYR
jgi:hypothetical protein